ncbi:MAG: ComEC/Rec2 family competence protein [Verrucomicrobiota bacterium]
MKLLSAPRQPFVGLAMAAALGIIMAEFFALSLFALIAISVSLAACALIALFRPALIVTYVIVGVSFFLLHNFRTTNTIGEQLAAQLGSRPRVVSATGFVVSEPTISNSGFATFLLKLKSIEFEEKNLPSKATWFVRWRGKPEFGDEVKLFGMAEQIEPPRNPGEFDMRAYLARADIRRSLFVRYEENGVLISKGGGNPVLRAAQRSRDWLQNVICRGLDGAPDVQSFLSGITLGLRRQTPEDIEEPFQQTGTLHLFAVAGLHVGIFAQLLWILTMVARLSRKWSAAIIIPALFFYAAVTGLHVSSVRAAVMGSILLGGILFERKVFLLNSLAAAAFFLLCWNTNELFSTGFQLSFAVVGAIVLLADPLFGFLRRWGEPDPFLPRSLLRGPRYWLHICFEWLCRGASVSLAAWIGSLLLILWYFYLVTPVSLLANLLVVPIAFFILAIAMLSLLAAPLLPWLSLVFNNANWSLVKLVIGIVHLCAQIPGGHVYVEHPHRPERLEAKVTVLDLGAGAAVHVRTGGGDWLFDCGSERDYERTLREYLHWAGLNRLHGLLLSHGDSLHIGGAASLMRDFPPARLIDNPLPDRSNIHQRLRRLFEERRIKAADLVLGDNFQLSHNVTAHILYPPRVLPATKVDDQTYVVRLNIASSVSMLFMSDSGNETERRLVNSGADLRSDILVKGQHHSGQSGSDTLLDAVKPKLIVATSRDFPETQRISDEWANKIRARGIKLFRQDETGAVTLRFGHHGWEAQSYITGETFRSPNR